MTSFALDLPQCRDSTRLRALRLSDLTRFAEYRADASLAEYQSWQPMSRDDAEKFLLETANATRLAPGQWIQLAIAEVSSDNLVGDVGLYMAEDCTFSELGFTLARTEQRKGHATRAAELAVEQAFRFATILEVRAVTDSLNQASLAALCRAGFVEVGTREAVFKGKSCTEVLLAKRRGEA